MGDKPFAVSSVEMTYYLRTHIILLGVLIMPGVVPALTNWEDARRVSKEEIVAAMHRQKDHGYVIEAIANATRLQSGIFLDLAEQALKYDPAKRPLRIGHQEYFEALLEVSGMRRNSIPTYIRIAHDYHEDYLIDGQMENVISTIKNGERPRRALNIKVGWPDSPYASDSYSYLDNSAQPHVEVTHKQVSSYRILDFGYAMVYDEIRGVTGRATTGLLGLIFKLLGKAEAVQTRFAFSSDGIQMSLTTARKLFTITQPVAIYPDGRIYTGVPPNRPDLAELEKKLRGLEFNILYVPLGLNPVP